MDPTTNTFDAEEYLLATEEAMDEALRGCVAAGGSNGAPEGSEGAPEGGGIKVVAISCFAMSLVQVDPGGRALSPVYTYASSASAGAALRLRERLREKGVLERVEQCTAPVHASYAPALFARLLEEEPTRDLGGGGATWVTLACFLLSRLTGKPQPVNSIP